MKNIIRSVLSVVLCLALLCGAAAFGEETVSITGRVSEIEKYGHALLDVTIADFAAAGFALGDVVTVSAGSYTGDMPYFDGYYVDHGGYMVRAYPGHENIAVCINYGKFAETAGVGVGDEVTITLKEKGGELAAQEISSLVYTTERADYASDEIFANFRMIRAGDIAEGRLYRSASPIDNEFGRAAISNQLAEAAGVRSVMNMGNTDAEIAPFAAEEGFASAYYKGLYDAGDVIALGMPVNFTSEEFAQGIVQGFTFLARHEPPYLVHCTEGKDRAGFASMLLEALMGATADEMLADYMLSYRNYYGVTAESDPAKYDMIVDKHIMEMLSFLAGVGKGAPLEGVDFAAAAEGYLVAHGMAREDVEGLRGKLR